MSSEVDKKQARIKRHRRVRKRVYGTSERPRLSVYKSLNHIYAQIIDDVSGRTLVSASTLSPDVREKIKSGGNIESAKLVGEAIGKKALDKNISKVVFDRGGYPYHGRVKALAEAAREAGLEF
ncbi:TPA: 50S ribosomal protein L18 [Candidatus Poribacteria bacterium]|nr:50S ribosomal protein L18 [Candidatus Poribacteria bacterium]